MSRFNHSMHLNVSGEQVAIEFKPAAEQGPSTVNYRGLSMP